MSLRFSYEDSIEPSRPLPDGWVAFRDNESDKEYYFHASTGETSWEHPDDHGWFAKIKLRMKDKTPPQQPYLGEPTTVSARSSDNALVVPVDPAAGELCSTPPPPPRPSTTDAGHASPSPAAAAAAATTAPSTSATATATSSTAPTSPGVAPPSQQQQQQQPPPPSDPLPLFTSGSSTGPVLLRDLRPLPPGWARYCDPKTGKDYFFHRTIEESFWEHPNDHSFLRKSYVSVQERRRSQQLSSSTAANTTSGGGSGSGSGGGMFGSFSSSGAKDKAADTTGPPDPTTSKEQLRGLLGALRKERKEREATEASLLQELQRRCDRINDLEQKLQVEHSKADELQAQRQHSLDKLTELKRELDALELRSQTTDANATDANATDAGAAGTAGADLADQPSDPAPDDGAAAAVEGAAAAAGGDKDPSVQLSALREEASKLETTAALAEQRFEAMNHLSGSIAKARSLVTDLMSAASTAPTPDNDQNGAPVDVAGGGALAAATNDAATAPLRTAVSTAAGVDLSLAVLLAEQPWSEVALSKLTVAEEACEWQAWSIFHHWSGEREYLPTRLQALLAGSSSHVKRQVDGGIQPAPPPPSVFCDGDTTRTVTLNKVTLPGMGWEWIGSWRVDLEVANTDRDGWRYAASFDEMTSPNGEGSDFAGGTEHSPHLKLRRRRWKRLRMLVRVPGLGGVSARILEMAERIASLEVMTNKLSEQLLEAQSSLMDADQFASRLKPSEEARKKAELELDKAKKQLAEYERRAHNDNAIERRLTQERLGILSSPEKSLTGLDRKTQQQQESQQKRQQQLQSAVDAGKSYVPFIACHSPGAATPAAQSMSLIEPADPCPTDPSSAPPNPAPTPAAATTAPPPPPPPIGGRSIASAAASVAVHEPPPDVVSTPTGGSLGGAMDEDEAPPTTPLHTTGTATAAAIAAAADGGVGDSVKEVAVGEGAGGGGAGSAHRSSVSVGGVTLSAIDYEDL